MQMGVSPEETPSSNNLRCRNSLGKNWCLCTWQTLRAFLSLFFSGAFGIKIIFKDLGMCSIFPVFIFPGWFCLTCLQHNWKTVALLWSLCDSFRTCWNCYHIWKGWTFRIRTSWSTAHLDLFITSVNSYYDKCVTAGKSWGRQRYFLYLSPRESLVHLFVHD